jgi:SAM-dependent methyltransferase
MSTEAARPRTMVRTAVVWEVLRSAIAGLAATVDEVTVLDVGGGTGGFAVPLAELGHQVTVVDPSPDSLAALARRASETETTERIVGLQGDATDIVDLLGPGSVDVVLCHSVLEVVDDPDDATAAIAAVLRPGGVASILVANRVAAVVARVAAGRLAEARALLADPGGTAGPADPMARRFTATEIDALLVRGGFEVASSHGIRVFSDAVPAALVDVDPHAVEDLVALEHAAAEDPAYAAVATQLHVLAVRR